MAYGDINHEPKCGLDYLPQKTIPFIWFFLRQAWRPYFLSVLFFAASALCEGLTPFFIGRVVNAINPPYTQMDLRNALLIAIIVGIIGARVLWSIGNWISDLHYARYFQEMVRLQLFKHVNRHPIGYFENDYSGRIAQKLNSVGEPLLQLTENISYTFLYCALILIAIITQFWRVDPILALITVGCLCLLVILCGISMKYVIPKSNAFFTQLNILHGVIVDMITNMRISRIFARTGLEATYLKTQSKHTSDARGQFYKGWVAMQIVTNFCFVVLAVTLSATAYYKFTKNIYDAGQLIFIISAIPTMIMACNFASYYASMAAEKIGTIREGISLIHTPQTDHQKTTDHTAHTTPTILHHKTAPKIDFQHIDFSYNQNAPLFTHFDFSISAGEKIGLVGRSGAGKSTLIDLLLRFKSPQNGEILIDNQPLSQFSQQEWQDYISIVPQNSMLFNRSILENIAYSRPEAKMDEIIIAAKQAHIHEFIQSLPQQYDSMVGENGVKLSGGQKQRIAIARALLKQAPILILDEATSALDTESEQHIQDSMRHLMDDKTVIVIAHRLSTLSRLDRLVILEQGKIIETGTHAALLANPQSHYKKLWDQQSDSFL